MEKGREKYEPTEDEIKNAKKIMTPEQKKLSLERQATLQRGSNEGWNEGFDAGRKRGERIQIEKMPEVIEAREIINGDFDKIMDEYGDDFGVWGTIEEHFKEVKKEIESKFPNLIVSTLGSFEETFQGERAVPYSTPIEESDYRSAAKRNVKIDIREKK